MKNNQKRSIRRQAGFAPIIIIFIIAITIFTGYGVYKSSNQFNIKSDKTVEKSGGRLQQKQPEKPKIDLANSGKLAEKPVTMPVEEVKKDREATEGGTQISIPRFSITPPAGWDRLPANSNIVLEFLSPAKDTIEKGMVYIDIQPNITVFVAKGDFENLEEANKSFSKNSKIDSRQKTTINGQEALVTQSTQDVADMLRDSLETQIKQEIAKSKTQIPESEWKEDIKKVLEEAKVKVISYSFYTKGYYINVTGKSLESYWSKREAQIKKSMDTFKLE